MKFPTVILGALALFLPAIHADSHGLCACQVGTDSQLNDKATGTCCGQWGGELTTVPAGNRIRWAGDYCQHDIDGDAWYECCHSQGAGDAACPW